MHYNLLMHNWLQKALRYNVVFILISDQIVTYDFSHLHHAP